MHFKVQEGFRMKNRMGSNEAVAKARGGGSREAIVEAAERLFLERGFGSVTMDELAEAAGVARRTLYGIERDEGVFDRRVGVNHRAESCAAASCRRSPRSRQPRSGGKEARAFPHPLASRSLRRSLPASGRSCRDE
jgi:Bacterial regulatory proteins, tetR family